MFARLLAFVLVCWTTVYSQKYCSICSDHTMCRFATKPSHSCGLDSVGGLSTDEIENILKVHNKFRATVANGREKRGTTGPQPSAANMQALLWDDKLAEVAQRWADQCTFQHDRCRDDPRFAVGQNIYWSSGRPAVDWSRAIESWYNEVYQMDPQNVSSYTFNYNTGHYAQLAWAKTRYIGCGRRTYGLSYRPQNSKALEYILSELPRSHEATHEQSQNDKPLRVDLLQSTIEHDHTITNDNRKRLPREGEGFFGGAKFDPQASKGAITGPPRQQEKILKETADTLSGYIINYFPAWLYPMAIGPNSPYYQPFGKYTSHHHFAANSEEEVNEDSSESEEIDKRKAEGNSILGIPLSSFFAPWLTEHWQNQLFIATRDQLLICNYGPSGRFVGEPIYEAGPPCSKCPNATKCVKGLCA